MTEEIIINDVNVAGCCYYEFKNDTGKWCDLTCTRDNAPVFRCEKMPNCYYKQLKRLEQENAELSIRVANLNERFINGFNYNEHRYKQALEEIREVLEKSCKQCKNEYLSEDYCSGQGDCYQIKQIIDELKEY